MLRPKQWKNKVKAGLEIKGCREPWAPLNCPSAPSNFSKEPKDALVSIRNTLK